MSSTFTAELIHGGFVTLTKIGIAALTEWCDMCGAERGCGGGCDKEAEGGTTVYVGNTLFRIKAPLTHVEDWLSNE